MTASSPVEDRLTKALSFPVGAASPLWLAFGAAATAGAAWWWMTRWARPVNLEAAALAEPDPAALEPEPVEAEAAPSPEAETPAPALEAVAVEPAPEPAVAEPEPVLEPEDLTRLVGIGPKLAVALAERGVTRFAQIAAWTADDLAEFDKALDLKGRAVRDAWVAQAARLA